MRVLRHAALAISLLAGGDALSASTSGDWDWAFPKTPIPAGAGAVPRQVPGSRRTFTDDEVHNSRQAVDWFPDQHPPMPKPVGARDGKPFACGYCHLPGGYGRPENSALAGLPPAYFTEQVQRFADGSRQAAVPGSVPATTMATIAKGLSEAEIKDSATYFAALRFASHVRVVEAAHIPKMDPEAFVYRPRGGAGGETEALGERIIETPDDFARFEVRDPNVRYTAYVPLGAVAAGKALVAQGGPAGQPCVACHGAGLKGGIGPPLAGRSPTMLFRQLAAFKAGTRANPEAAPMRAIASQLDVNQMIALAAYAASREP